MPTEKDALVESITALFSNNQYQIEGPLQIHGAELDLRAVSKSDSFAVPIFIEATEQYVDTIKYGKDLTKLAMLAVKEPASRRLIISSKGFTKEVKERAAETRVETFTYDELFQKFERFGPYADATIKTGPAATELSALNEIYEEAMFVDKIGKHQATEFLSAWKSKPSDKQNWIIIVGEYGTGKTALTRILQFRWLSEYIQNPAHPIPLRIELSAFSRQFDHRTLLHHFLDSNHLGHISIDFIEHLLRMKRVILLLDGYDEMAQHLHARERRACLEALAYFSSQGCRGLITSRPNYFTEAEELRILELVYRRFDSSRRLSEIDKSIIEKEKETDAFLQKQFIDRFERTLRDLDRPQTESLIKRVLKSDPEGQRVILRVLDRLFRANDGGVEISLSGKPVIISYLLDLVEQLKDEDRKKQLLTPGTKLGEWQIYDLIVNQLMSRDYKQRSSEMLPGRRRAFLEEMAIRLSQREAKVLDEEGFQDLVKDSFADDLRKVAPQLYKEELERYFADLRGSGTLTRIADSQSGKMIWRFSHNSLREFLSASYLKACLESCDIAPPMVPITEPMQVFADSMDLTTVSLLLESLQKIFLTPGNGEKGVYVELLWRAALRRFASEPNPVASFLRHLSGTAIDMKGIRLNRLPISDAKSPEQLEGSIWRNSRLTDVRFDGAVLRRADFGASELDGVSFQECDLQNAVFSNSILIDVDFSDSNLAEADFTHVDPACRIRAGGNALEGNAALGYIWFLGAKVDPIDPIFRAIHHPRFEIAHKICRKLIDQPIRQILGLTQKGAAKGDVDAAREFVDLLISGLYLEVDPGRPELVRLTERGRPVLAKVAEKSGLHDSLEAYFT